MHIPQSRNACLITLVNTVLSNLGKAGGYSVEAGGSILVHRIPLQSLAGMKNCGPNPSMPAEDTGNFLVWFEKPFGLKGFCKKALSL